MSAKPLIDGADVSWLPWARPGDNQGHVGACSVFAIANCMEIVLEEEISDQACLDTYHEGMQRLHGGGDHGLYVPEAFDACQRSRIVPAGYALRVERDLRNLRIAPLVVTYALTVGWNHPNSAGCVDHNAKAKLGGEHAEALVAKGTIGRPPVEQHIVWVENSWGHSQGYHGFEVMLESFHKQHVTGIWQIRRT
jgi:hypothetical protein